MQLSLPRRTLIVGAIVLAIIALVAVVAARTLLSPPQAHAAKSNAPVCTQRPQLCTETAEPWNANGQYTGHDEPSVLFYSNRPGSGNSTFTTFTLPRDPIAAPSQDGSGSTWDFQLRPTFWFGMAMCDDQDAPNPGVTCTPDSDTNIHTSTDPNSPNYIGLTPGTAFMEMQFYPPGWGPISCTDANGRNDGKWCAALTIDSVQSNSNTGQQNNAACNNLLGPEPVNWAMITKSGHSQVPARPDTGFGRQATTTADTLEFNNGDQLTLGMQDTAAGFQVVINDVTTGGSGSMTASIANGFGHALFRPTDSTCTMVDYAYHPMYSTSSPDTRVLWAAHSYNVAMSDEIGHFEYCTKANQFGGKCVGGGSATDPKNDGDDNFCFPYPVVSPAGATISSLTGCIDTDTDFDGANYHNGAWPGSPGAVASQVSTPVQFSSLLFNGPGGLRNYQQVAFETDLPRIEGADVSTTNTCQRHVSNPADPSPGSGCVIPPLGPGGVQAFYPSYTATTANGSCVWQEGGTGLPGNNFGGTAEYGGLLLSNYPAVGFKITQRYNNFRNVLSSNPCVNPSGLPA